jgi:uridylate kinase
MSPSPKRERIVVSVGGSLLVPDTIDTEFISRFCSLIQKKVSEGFSFYIIAGGGKLARQYRDAARIAQSNASSESLDWVGISATRANAEVLRAVLGGENIPPVVLDTRKRPSKKSSLYIAGGVRPGNSSDWAAVMAAHAFGAKKLVNLSNIDYVYTADPRTNPDAKKIERISWKEFRSLIPSEWDPGLSSPFDPVAAREAERMKLEVAVINGANLAAFEDYINGTPFSGTTIA